MHDAEFISWKIATEQTAKYICEKMHSATIFKGNVQANRHDLEGREKLLDFALSKTIKDGLYLEFGVHKGESINFIANKIGPEHIIHGFDSFEGLPEQWFLGRKEGRFSLEGEIPQVENNVVLHQGWFDSTLPRFLSNNEQHISLCHIDSDIYSSAKTVLECCRDRFVPGTIIVFDEYFNYPGWEQHEFKAFQEFVKEYGLKYEYLGMAPCHYSVAITLR